MVDLGHSYPSPSDMYEITALDTLGSFQRFHSWRLSASIASSAMEEWRHDWSREKCNKANDPPQGAARNRTVGRQHNLWNGATRAISTTLRSHPSVRCLGSGRS